MTGHASRQNHLRFGQSEYLGAIANRRAISWERAATPKDGATELARILFSLDLLRGGHRPLSPDMVLFEPAPSGEALEVTVFFAEGKAAETSTDVVGWLPFGRLSLENGEVVVLAIRSQKMDVSSLGPLAELIGPSPRLPLPVPLWTVDGYKTKEHRNVGAVVWIDPGPSGPIRLSQVTGLRIDFGDHASRPHG